MALGLEKKPARFFCHMCRTSFDGILEASRLKVLNWNGSCARQETFCQDCTEKHLDLTREYRKKNG